MRRSFMNACPTTTARVEFGHLRGHAAFIQINQAFRRNGTDFFKESALLIGFGIALGGVERLFLSRRPSFLRSFQICGKLSETSVSARPTPWLTGLDSRG
jgi:hypothetical protein